PCGAVVTVTAGAPHVPASTARPARPAAVRPVSQPAGRMAAAPSVPAGGSPYFEGSGDLSSLFDELTESDLQTKRDREREATESEAAAKDPLAAYRPNQGGRAARSGRSGPRPVGLTILAVLNFLLAALMLALGALFLIGPQVLGDALADVEFVKDVATVVAVSLLVVGVFCAATGAGLLSGAPWGWWLGASVYAYSAF